MLHYNHTSQLHQQNTSAKQPSFALFTLVCTVCCESITYKIPFVMITCCTFIPFIKHILIFTSLPGPRPVLPPSLLTPPPPPLCSTAQTPLLHWFPPLIVLLIRTGIAPVHPPSLYVSTLTDWRRWAWNLLSVVEDLAVLVLVRVVGGGGWEHVLTSLSAHPSVNLWDASWYGRTGWAWLPSCLPAHWCLSVLPVETQDFALRSLHAWAQVALSVCVDTPASQCLSSAMCVAMCAWVCALASTLWQGG